MTPSSLLILLFSILFCSGTCVLAVLLKRSNSTKDKMLAEMQADLHSLKRNGIAGDDTAETEQDGIFFTENLRSAEITTKLQQSRLTVQQNSNIASAPERYRYILSLLEMGLNAKDIASTLSMSLEETTQIIALIRIANPVQLDAASPTPSPSLEESSDLNQHVPAIKPDPNNCVSQEPLLPQKHEVVNKSMKLARWLKRHASSINLRKQGSREPPRNPLPHKTALRCDPLSGYI
ncbi:MAG: hypothetical protein J0652_07575 [Desulfobulbaceae bacterium]|nr:hypothetical protein [Desulfobulbaceae bacterium]